MAAILSDYYQRYSTKLSCMEPFITHPVVFNGNKQHLLPVGVIVLMLVSIVVAIIAGYNVVATWLFLGLIGIVVIASFLFKGRFLSFDLSQEQLIITDRKITLGKKKYPLHELRKLVFTVHSYKGLEIKQFENRRPQRRKRFKVLSDGMDNYLSFLYAERKITIRFYLNSKKHTVLLCDVLREWYKNKTPFIEMDMNGEQTYLMQRLSREELDAFKLQYGYKI